MSDDEFADLPDDNEAAFILLHSRFHSELITLSKNTSGELLRSRYLDYMNKTMAAAQALQQPILQELSLPSLQDAQADFTEFYNRINNYIIQIKIRIARRAKGYSVTLTQQRKKRYGITSVRLEQLLIGSNYQKKRRKLCTTE